MHVVAAQLGHFVRATSHHGHPERLNRHGLGGHHHLDPSDVTLWIVRVDVFRLLERVDEAHGTNAAAFTVIVIDNPDLLLGVENAYPVEQFVIVPCGTSGPLLAQ